MNIELIPLKLCDGDLAELVRIHNEPSVSSYISISWNYFEYVTETKGVTYFKIMVDGIAAGGIHCERSGSTMYLSICVDEDHRRLGIAEKALQQLFADTKKNTKSVEINVNDTNYPSVRLFTKLGFVQTGEKDGSTQFRLPLT